MFETIGFGGIEPDKLLSHAKSTFFAIPCEEKNKRQHYKTLTNGCSGTKMWHQRPRVKFGAAPFG